jgi:hypothetical protein
MTSFGKIFTHAMENPQPSFSHDPDPTAPRPDHLRHHRHASNRQCTIMKTGEERMADKQFKEPADEAIDPGCDICGTVISPDDPGSYLRFEDDIDVYGHVCSWLCAIEFALRQAKAQQKHFKAHIDELQRTNQIPKDDTYRVGFYRAGVLKP